MSNGSVSPCASGLTQLQMDRQSRMPLSYGLQELSHMDPSAIQGLQVESFIPTGPASF